MSGSNGVQSSTFYPQSSYRDAISTKAHKLPLSSCMASVMHQKMCMLRYVVYLRITDTFSKTQVSLVSSKTKVATIKKLTIPRLELCGAYLLTQLLFTFSVFNMPLSSVYAWTDSTIVLKWWLVGNPRRFKTYVGNRVSELIAPERRNYVEGTDNPADCASRGIGVFFCFFFLCQWLIECFDVGNYLQGPYPVANNITLAHNR